MILERFNTFIKAILTVAEINIRDTMLLITGIILESCDFFSNEYFHSSKIATLIPIAEVDNTNADIIHIVRQFQMRRA